MTTTTPTATHRSSAPLGRVLLSELRWVLRRPRNLLALLGLAALPVLIGTVVALTGGPSPGDGPALLASVAGNGLVLPIVTLVMTQSLLLPLVTAMVAADALAGESAHGTLRGLLLAPVGRVRLVWVKATGVLVMTVLSVAVIAVVGVLTGLVIVGSDGLVTLSGTTLPLTGAIGRVALAAGWSMTQMAGIGAIALAVSALTEHPLVVLAVTVGGLIVFGVLGELPALEWLRPFLITTDLYAVADVLRDPIPTGDLITGLWRAGCYVLIGVSATVARMATRDV
ncbi:ABC-2 type transport system permease protein [Saccharopolyspora lacisalsi]|uniref:ABC-2 type transport system permease protein n=1 Tax=Halosaccharopolyspora lacisalsi TaxID=1000566 RepID=A0A839DVU1_9PSEU|nr:ABC transporter permease subunit [Halosaccharopolyspora lacisalsi]MBA8822918.1 ABC-2 type transport system permease protein [Halosaccharopolyspora lacisalsi]